MLGNQIAMVSPPHAWELPRRASVAAWRTFNTTLDEVFYDVGALSSGERAGLAAHAAPEGAVLVVHPGASEEPIRRFAPVDFVQEQETPGGGAVDTVVIAGVGSSALGTAALARDVADHLGRPVAGIVSGLGMSDVLSEALGGWFVFGARNALRETLAVLFDAYDLRDHVRDESTHRDMKQRFVSAGVDTDHFIYGSPDSATLLYLLLKLGGRIRRLVGHSKGNYSIENALEGWLEHSRNTGTPIHPALCIVTLGAVIRFPPDYTELYQLIGQLDCFGLLNSRLFVERIGVPGAAHSLNLAVPGHLSVRAALETVDRLQTAAAGAHASTR